MLGAAGINPPDDEIQMMANAYPGLRAQVELFYAVETETVPPATMLRAAE